VAWRLTRTQDYSLVRTVQIYGIIHSGYFLFPYFLFMSIVINHTLAKLQISPPLFFGLPSSFHANIVLYCSSSRTVGTSDSRRPCAVERPVGSASQTATGPICAPTTIPHEWRRSSASTGIEGNNTRLRDCATFGSFDARLVVGALRIPSGLTIRLGE